MKSHTYRIRFVGREFEDSIDENGILIRNKLWTEVLDERLAAGAIFVCCLHLGGEYHLTLREVN